VRVGVAAGAQNFLENEFWLMLEESLKDKLDNLATYNPTLLIHLMYAFAKTSHGSGALWNEFTERSQNHLFSLKLQPQEVMKLAKTFSIRKKGDDVFWDLLEKKTLEILDSSWVILNKVDIMSMVKAYGQIKRGSRQLWTSLVRHVAKKQSEYGVRELLFLAKTLSIQHELNLHEVNTLLDNLLNRLTKLPSENELISFFQDISNHGYICKLLSNEHVKVIENKINSLVETKAAGLEILDKIKQKRAINTTKIAVTIYK